MSTELHNKEVKNHTECRLPNVTLNFLVENKLIDNPNENTNKPKSGECGEIIPKKEKGKKRIKICPKCGKKIPKKYIRMKKYFKFLKMLHEMNKAFQLNNNQNGYNFNGQVYQPYFMKQEVYEVHHYFHIIPYEENNYLPYRYYSPQLIHEYENPSSFEG